MSKADTLTPKQINRVLRTCKLMKSSEAKRCALVLSFSAIRVTEIALLDTKTLMFANGRLRDEVHLPAKICKSLKPRTIWLSNPTTRAILQEWIDYRIKKRWGMSLNNTDYQGLIPTSKFLLSNRARSYALQPKPRRLDSGEIKTYWACDSLEQAFREIYKKCGLPNNSSHSGRKALCSNAVKNGVSLDQLARILGHSDISTTIKYVCIDKKRLKAMYSIDWI